MIRSNVQKLLRNITICAILAVVGLFALIGLSRLADGPPYRMTLRSSDGHSFVRFMQRDRGLVTADIPVDIVVQGTWVIDLDGDDVPIPGFKIEFFDSAPSPGRFRISIGSTKLDIMEAYYVVNGEKRLWNRL